MNYFLKKHKLVAWVVMLTFLFSMVMPTNLGLGNAAEAAGETTMVDMPVTMFDYGSYINNRWQTSNLKVLEEYAKTFGDDGLYFTGQRQDDNGKFNNKWDTGNGAENGKNKFSGGNTIYQGIASNQLTAYGVPAINGKEEVGRNFFGDDNETKSHKGKVYRTAADSTRTSLRFHYDPSTNRYSYDSEVDDTDGQFWPYGKQNFYFGMKMHLDFAMPTDGKINNTDPMVFNFSGDDDMWVYIDGKLALDIGGIHEAAAGSINFAEQRVYYDCPINNSNSKLITEGGKKYVAFSDLGLNDFAVGGHTLDLFYLERGAGNSNCKIEFNLLTFTGNPNLKKYVTGNSAFLSDETTYTFQVLDENDAPCEGLEYEVYGGTQAVKGTLLADGKITLTAAQLAAFNVEAKQKIKMVELDAEAYATHLKVEQLPKTGTSKTLQDADVQESDAITIPDTNVAKVNYYFTNSLKDVADLTITKALEGGITDDKTEFTFKVTFDTMDEDCASEVKDDALVYTGAIYDEADKLISVNANGFFTLKAGETATIKDVPLNAGYKVEEIPDKDSPYECLTDADKMTGTLTANTTVAVVNGYPTTPAIVTVTKVWEGTPLESVQVQLQKSTDNGTTWTEYETVTLEDTAQPEQDAAEEADKVDEPAPAAVLDNPDETTPAAPWTYTWTDLVKKHGDTEYTYRVVELDADGKVVEKGGNYSEAYRTSYSYSDNTSSDSETTSDSETKTLTVTITNTEVVNIAVSKVWNVPANMDVQLPDVTVNVYNEAAREADPGVRPEKQATLTAEGNWEYTFENLPKYDENKNKISYVVEETEVPGYTSEVTGDAEKGFVITNTWNLQNLGQILLSKFVFENNGTTTTSANEKYKDKSFFFKLTLNPIVEEITDAVTPGAGTPTDNQDKQDGTEPENGADSNDSEKGNDNPDPDNGVKPDNGEGTETGSGSEGGTDNKDQGSDSDTNSQGGTNTDNGQTGGTDNKDQGSDDKKPAGPGEKPKPGDATKPEPQKPAEKPAPRMASAEAQTLSLTGEGVEGLSEPENTVIDQPEENPEVTPEEIPEVTPEEDANVFVIPSIRVTLNYGEGTEPVVLELKYVEGEGYVGYLELKGGQTVGINVEAAGCKVAYTIQEVFQNGDGGYTTEVPEGLTVEYGTEGIIRGTLVFDAEGGVQALVDAENGDDVTDAGKEAISYSVGNTYAVSPTPIPDPDPQPEPEPKPNPNPNPPTPPVVPIDDEDVPQAEPEVIPEEDVPMVDVPGEEVTEVVDTPVPLGDAPAMGDSSNAFAFAMVLLAAGLGLVVTRRKFN